MSLFSTEMACVLVRDYDDTLGASHFSDARFFLVCYNTTCCVLLELLMKLNLGNFDLRCI
jgi:hypothetical protein